MAHVPAAFKAGPVVAESSMVVQGRDGYLFCFDANSGSLKWRYFVQRTAFHKGFLETGPCIWNGRAYAAFHSMGHPGVTGMRCFDLRTGDLIWKRDVGWTQHRIHYSPQVANGRLFFCSNREITGKKTEIMSELQYRAQVQCWDAMTGDTLWSYNMWDSSCQNTTLLVSGDTVFASVGLAYGSPLGRTAAFKTDGTLLWQTDSSHVYGYVGNMQYANDRLLVLTAGSSAMRMLNPADGSILLRAGGGDAYSKVMPVMNGRYYSRGYADFARPFNFATGQSVAYSISGGGRSASGCAGPVAANGYIFSHFGNPYKATGVTDIGHSIAAADENGNVVWKFKENSNHCASVAVAYGKLYLASGTEGYVYCFENAQ